MSKLFKFAPYSRSLSDKISGTIPINSSVVFRRLEKGYSAHFSSTADLNTFGIVTGVKTIIMMLKPTSDTKLLQDNGTDKIEINGGNISGTGLTECTVNTVDTDVIANNVWSLVIAEFSGGIDFSTDLEIDVTAEVDILSIVCYDEVLSMLQKDNLWLYFNHLNPISFPIVLRPRIEVDFMGSVLCHDYQNWRGGTVTDTSGFGNNGTPLGFIDPSHEGAMFDSVTSGFDCGNPSAVNDIGTGNFTIKAYVNPLLSASAHRGIVSKKTWGDWGLDLQQGKNLRFHNIGVSYISFHDLDDKKWHLLGITRRGNLLYHFNDGVTWGTPFDITGMTLNNSNNLYIGSRFSSSPNYIFYGGIKFVTILPYSITDEKIQSDWNKVADLVIFNGGMFNQLPDGITHSTGEYLDKWYISSGTFVVKEDSIGKYIECLGNGVIQYKGINFSMYYENGFVKKLVGDLSSDQGKSVDDATNVAWANNELSVTFTTGQKLYELVISKGEKV